MTEKFPKNIKNDNEIEKSVTKTALIWESFWNENENFIKEALGNFYKENVYFDIDNKNYVESLERALSREKEFSKILFETLKKSLEKNNKVAMLFDVDETIGNGLSSYGGKEEPHTFIRPSFILFLEKIKNLIDKGSVDIGLLTTRGLLKEQLDDKEHLFPIKDYVNPDYLCSTRIDSLKNRDTNEMREEIENDSDSILNQKMVKKEGYTRNLGVLKKLILLKNLKSLHPDTLFVVMDDLRYPKCLDVNKGIIGIELDGNTGFYI